MIEWDVTQAAALGGGITANVILGSKKTLTNDWDGPWERLLCGVGVEGRELWILGQAQGTFGVLYAVFYNMLRVWCIWMVSSRSSGSSAPPECSLLYRACQCVSVSALQGSISSHAASVLGMPADGGWGWTYSSKEAVLFQPSTSPRKAGKH